MKKSDKYERKIIYLLLHQLFILWMVIGFFIYEHQFLINQNHYAAIYLSLCCFSFIGGIIFLFLATRQEVKIYKNRSKKGFLDKIYPEVLVGIILLLLLALGTLISRIRISEFTLAGLIIVTFCVAYAMDTIFLIGYFNILRRIICKQLKL